MNWFYKSSATLLLVLGLAVSPVGRELVPSAQAATQWIFVAPSAPVVNWTPLTEGDVKIWLRGDTTSGSGGSFRMVDKGPNGYDATVYTGAGPTVVTSTANSQPAVRFVASSSDALQMAGTNVVLNKDTDNTVIAVGRFRSVVSGFGVFLSLCTSAATYTAWSASDVGGYRNFFTGGGTAFADTNTGVDGFDYYSTFFTLMDLYSGGGSFSSAANHVWRRNGVTQTLSDAAGGVGTGTCISTLGSYGPSGLNADYDLLELVVFGHKLAAPAQASWDAYQLSRYGF